MTICISCFIGSLACLGIASYIMGAAVMGDIKRNLHSINDNAKINRYQPSKIIEQFSDFIPFHSMTKELSITWRIVAKIRCNWLRFCFCFCNRFILNISEIAQPMFMVHFALTLALICSIMLMIQTEIVQYTYTIQRETTYFST